MSGAMLRGSLVRAGASSLKVGHWVELCRAWSGEDVEAFSRLSGDHNPVHLDEEFAATTPFGTRIAHGMLSAGLFGTALATAVPGVIYLSQNLKFTAPVYLQDTVVARCEIAAVDRRRVAVNTHAFVVPSAVAAQLATLGADDPRCAHDLQSPGAEFRTVITGDARIMLQ